MNKTKYVFWLLSVVFLVLVSCTHEDQDDSIKFLKSIVETTDGGSVKITTFSYNGAEISSIVDDSTIKEFKYNLGLITAIDITNKTTSVKTTVEYFYENGKLIQVKLAGDYMINYVHNSDGTISYEKFDISTLNLKVKIHHGVLTFKNGNIIKEERVLDNQAVGVISKYNVYYDYDYKLNPLHNIVGYDKLLDHEELMSSNNYLISTVETSVEKDGQIISSASFYKNTFQYDKRNYPIEKNSLVSIPHKGISYNLKTTYHY
ncbi:hypothetical protein SLW70_06640 [Flavobacterium sp. NG2]|uniref:hypothetical protein n=1 Tax=Flavobacterium sp. NG2 TaxID=3097547 RepID=UPI002A808D8A|nr:hypothetical protein [Flavobacterium sp. NG2]WPR72799.1 hypothetical protein SLW70_06640 [Flavobacterium sp. NG2]